MRVDGGDHCNGFLENRLFYVLFIFPTSVQVSGGSTFLAAGMGLVPVNFQGLYTL